MNVRTTQQLIVSQSIANAARQTAAIGRFQTQASTGLRISRPSDDPVGISTLLLQRTSSRRLDSFLGNVQEARSALDQSVSSLTAVNSSLVRARQIALSADQVITSGSPAEINTMANELDTLLERIMSLANQKHNGRFLYGGTSVSETPFEAIELTDGTQQIVYRGSQDGNELPVSETTSVQTLFAGDEVFQQRQRGETVFVGLTGAESGTGTDSGVARSVLTVRQTGTTIAPGSGVSSGTSASTVDTLIGSHSLEIIDLSGIGTSGTVTLNGGDSFSFTSADTDLVVTGPFGEKITVNTSAIVPGFSGTVAVTGSGTLSTDNGLTETAIVSSPNQQVINSETGELLNVDSSGIKQAGTENIEFPGTYDVFQVVMTLRDDFNNSRNLTTSDLGDSVARFLGEIDRLSDTLLNEIGNQSVDLQNLESLEIRIGDEQLEVKRVISEIESADLAEVLVGLQTEQNLLQVTLATTARMFDQNLLDFLR